MEINKIYNRNCIDAMRELPNECIDEVVSDPPYLIGYKTNRRKEEHRFGEVILNDDNPKLISDFFDEIYRLLKNNTGAYVFCSTKTLTVFLEEAKRVGFVVKNIIVWNKGNWTSGDLEGQFGQQWEPLLLLNKGRKTINGHRYGDVWECKRVVGDTQIHQNQKPLSLIERCIETHSKEGDLILDPFMGSATTAIASIRNHRNFIGYELDKGYFEKAQKRIKEELMQPQLF